MQGIGLNRDRVKILFKTAIPVLVLIFLVLADQIIKTYVKNLYENNGWRSTEVIKNFFYFTYSFNKGAAFSFLADTVWGQIFFKVLTCIALVFLFFAFIFASNRSYGFLKFALIIIIAGTIGNFIDRLAYNGVVDYISFIFGSYAFPVFNLADSLLTVGVIMVIIHFLFLDRNGVFVRKNGNKNVSN